MGAPRVVSAWLVLSLLLGGCASVRTVARSAPAEELAQLEEALPRKLELGVARFGEDRVVLSYDVETRAARDLQVRPDGITWVDEATGRQRGAPLQALRWIRWTPPDPRRLSSALKLGGLGGLGGAALGAVLGFVFGYAPDVCVGGGYSSEVGYFEKRCFPDWPPKVGVGAAIGAGVGLVAGALVGALLGERQVIELTGPVVPNGARCP